MNKDPKRFTRTPYFEHPSWFTEPVVNGEGKTIKPAQNFYYDNKTRVAGGESCFYA